MPSSDMLYFPKPPISPVGVYHNHTITESCSKQLMYYDLDYDVDYSAI